jgi:orotidine-5'-phosphate decarboxylase
MSTPGGQTKLSPEVVANVIKQHLQVEQNIGTYIQQLEAHANTLHSASGSSMTKVAIEQAEELRTQCRNAVSQPITDMTQAMDSASSNTQQTDQDTSQAVQRASQAMAGHLSPLS